MKPMNQAEPLAVSVREAIHLMSLSRTQFYREIAAGRLVARKAGKRTLVPMAAIKEWLRALPVSNIG